MDGGRDGLSPDVSAVAALLAEPARVCYDHLAGAAGVRLADRLQAARLMTGRDAFTIRSLVG